MADGSKSAIATGISVVIDVLQMIKRDRDQFMNKAQLIVEIAENADITQIKAKAVLNIILDRITESLKKHESVQLMGFGTFKVKPRKARTAHNPKTRKKMEIPACHVPVLSFGKFLKDELKGSQSVEKKTKLVAPVRKKQKMAAK